MSRDQIIQEVPGGFVVPGVARIEHAPHRSRDFARQFAVRIAAQPRAYLAACRDFDVPGIIDLRYGDDGGPQRAISRGTVLV